MKVFESPFNKAKFCLGLLTSALLGLAVFQYTYGIALLDPQNYSWLLSGDPYVYFFGFNFFNQEAWQIPLGNIARYSFPEGTSIVYTDSIPWIAIVLKALHFNTLYQYHGAWIAFCFALQGAGGFALFYQKTRDFLISALGVMFLVTLPTFLLRGFQTTRHYSLIPHFLLLGLIALLIQKKPSDESAQRKQFWLWAALLTLALGIHFYLFLLVGIFFVANEFPNLRIEKKQVSRKHFWLGGALLAVAYLLGYFTIPLGNSTAGGFGLYSMNLNSLVNGAGFSRLLSFDLLNNLQLEGYQYLGLGLMIAFLFWLRPRDFKFLTPSQQFAGLFLLLLALSFRLSLGSHIAPEWLSIPLFSLLIYFFFQKHRMPKLKSVAFTVLTIALLFVFGKVARASGRMFWPIEYLCIFIVIAKRPNRIVLAGLVALQLWDVFPAARAIHDENLVLAQNPVPRIAYGDQLPKTLTHIALQDPNRISVIPLLSYAAENHLSIGPLIVARASSVFRKEEQQQLTHDLLVGPLSPHTLYIVGNPDTATELNFKCQTHALQCESIFHARMGDGTFVVFQK